MYIKLNNQGKSSDQKYYQVTRGTARSKLKGYDCPDCHAFFKALDDNQLREICSRHRCRHEPLGPQPDILPINNILTTVNQNAPDTVSDMSNSDRSRRVTYGFSNEDKVFDF